MTLENHGRPGYEDVVTSYDEVGQVVRSYAIDDIYTQAAIAEMPRTVTIQGWRHELDHPRFYGDLFWVLGRFENALKFSTEDASLIVAGPRTEKFLANIQREAALDYLMPVPNE